MIALFLFMGCGPPPDPSDPAASKPAQNAEAFLVALQQGRDAEAYAMLAYPESYPEFTVENFGRRAEHLGLREPGVVWTQVTYFRPTQDEWLFRQIEKMTHVAMVYGRLNGKPLELKESEGALSGVKIGTHILTDIVDSHIHPAPPPLPGPAHVGALSLTWEQDSLGHDLLRLETQAEFQDTQASFSLNTRCKVGERWLRHAMGFTREVPEAGTHPLSLETRVTRASTCEVMLETAQTGGRHQSRVCLEQGQITDGPCPEQPQGNAAPDWLSLSDVREVPSSTGVSIESRVLANRTPPAHAARPTLSLRTTLSCADGERFDHGRPINADWLLAGESRDLGAVFVEQLALPCTVHQSSVYNDPYSRVEAPLFEGCLEAEGVSEAPCPG